MLKYLLASLIVATSACSSLPVARTVPVVDRTFGLDVPDPYRWMEGDKNAEFDSWLRAQGAFASRELARLPGRDQLAARIRELGYGTTAVWGVQSGGDTMIHWSCRPATRFRRWSCARPAGKRGS